MILSLVQRIFFISIILLPFFAWGEDTTVRKPHESGYPTGSCIDRCHVNYMAYRTLYQGEVFRHNTHSPTQGVECRQCHNNDAVNTKTHGGLIIQNKDCNTCHHKETNNEGCLKCHADVKDYRNGNIQNITMKIPDWMSKAVSCTDCHKRSVGGYSFNVVREYCIDCHNADYGLLYDAWKETLDDTKNRFPAGSMRSREVQTTLKIVRSYGMHNFRLSQILLKSVEP